jgi:hypothetical protein
MANFPLEFTFMCPGIPIPEDGAGALGTVCNCYSSSGAKKLNNSTASHDSLQVLLGILVIVTDLKTFDVQ